MGAAQTGDGAAYAELLWRVAPLLRRLVRRRRSWLRAEDVEDLVQDVLLSLHAVRATYNPARPFMPWLLAITRNRLADGARAYARRAAHEVSLENPEVTFPVTGPNNTGVVYDDREALVRAVQALPAGQRRAVEMLKLREMSLKEAAAASGTSIAALKVAVHRGMGTLRRSLKRT